MAGDAAKDKIMMGAERKSMVMSEEEKEMTAYHEAGHAIVGRLVPEHDPVYKVSIIPRGRALGVTMYLPEQDRVSHSKQHLESMLSACMVAVSLRPLSMVTTRSQPVPVTT